MELVLGIDLGTSYFKLGVFDRSGKLHGLGRVPVKTDNVDGTRCELPAERFWLILNKGLKHALQQANAKASDIQGVGYSSQVNSFILLDNNDKPLTPLILWPDSRVEKIDPAVEQLFERDDFLNTTGIGLEVTNLFAISKLLWFRKNQPALWEKVNRIMTISDYLTFSLTGKYVGDAGGASLLGILNLKNLSWWPEALEILDICPEKLSKPLRTGTLTGPLTETGSKLLGLNPQTPFVVGSFDHHVAAIGAGLGQIAEVSESTGTVLACIKYTDKYNPEKNVCMGPDVNENNFYKVTLSSNGASVLEWYQKTYSPQHSIGELVKMAEDVQPGCDGLVALPSANEYENLEGFQNIKPSHSPKHFVRAIMESTTQSLAELVDNLYPEGRPKKIVATGGGAQSDLWLQMKADLLGIEFVRTKCHEPACMGAGMLAAVAAEWFTTIEQTGETWVKIDLAFEPIG